MEKLNIKKFNQTVLNSKFTLSKKHLYLCVKAKNPIFIQLSFTWNVHFSALLSDLWQLVRQINWLSPWFSANDRQRDTKRWEREFLSKPSSSFWSCNVLTLFRVLLFNFNSLITSPGCFFFWLITILLCSFIYFDAEGVPPSNSIYAFYLCSAFKGS